MNTEIAQYSQNFSLGVHVIWSVVEEDHDADERDSRDSGRRMNVPIISSKSIDFLRAASIDNRESPVRRVSVMFDRKYVRIWRITENDR